MRPAVAIVAVLVIALTGITAIITLFRGADDGDVQAFYDRMHAAMSRPGTVLHTSYTVYDCDQTDAWIDTEVDAVLEELHYLCDEDEGAERRTLYRDGKWWSVASGGVAQIGEREGGCRGADAEAVIFFMNCPWRETVRLRVYDDERHNGRPVVALRATGEAQGIDSRIEFDEYLYLDAVTGLPLTQVREFRDFYGSTENPVTERLEWTYQHEFVDRGDLPGNLFAPEGYRQ
jgi:hypothetical protein